MNQLLIKCSNVSKYATQRVKLKQNHGGGAAVLVRNGGGCGGGGVCMMALDIHASMSAALFARSAHSPLARDDGRGRTE